MAGVQIASQGRNCLVEEVFSPTGVGVAEHPHEMPAGVEAEGPGLFAEAHAGFVRGAIPLAVVTGVATADEILPGGTAAAGAGHDMIEREFARG